MEDRVNVDGSTVYYRVEGEGEPVVLIHGNGLSHAQWNYNVGPISRGHRVIAPDMPGFGLSDKPDAPYGLPYYTEFLRSFMDTIGVSHLSVVGHSYGGAIAAAFAARYPGRVDRLVLSNATGVSPAGYLYNKGLSNILMNMMIMNRKIYCRPMFYNPVASSLLDDAVLVTDEKEIRKAFLRNCEDIARYDASYIESLKAIKAPTLIVWGRNDMLLSVSDAKKYKDLIGGSTLRLIDQCGHIPNVEKYLEFNESVVDFLSGE